MSIVLATDRYATVSEVVQRFRAQTIHDRLELTLVVPEAAASAARAASLDGFAASRVVPVDSIVPLAAARAAGVRAGTAPLVFIGETHSYPHPRLAESLVDAHAAPLAMAVPAFRNANPESALSWAAFLTDYGGWVEGQPAGEPDSVPTYNVAYRRSFLIGLGEGLELSLAQGHEMRKSLHRAGGRALFVPAARMEHANVSRLWPWLDQRYVAGRVFAANRSAGWSRARRIVYGCGAPLIPFVLLARRRDALRDARRRGTAPPATLPALVLDTMIRATGEMVGYAGGASPSCRDRLDEYEIHKVAHTHRPAVSPSWEPSRKAS